MSDNETSRRKFLKAAGILGAGGLAGCSSLLERSSEDSTPTGSSPTATGLSTRTPSPTTISAQTPDPSEKPTETHTETPTATPSQAWVETYELAKDDLLENNAREFQELTRNDDGSFTEFGKRVMPLLTDINSKYGEEQVGGVARSVVRQKELNEEDRERVETWMSSEEEFAKTALANGLNDRDNEGLREGVEYNLAFGGVEQPIESWMGPIVQKLEENLDTEGYTETDTVYLQNIYNLVSSGRFKSPIENDYGFASQIEVLNLGETAASTGNIKEEVPQWLKNKDPNSRLMDGIRAEIEGLEPGQADSTEDFMADITHSVLNGSFDLDNHPGKPQQYIEVININGAEVPGDIYDAVQKAFPTDETFDIVFNNTKDIEIEDFDDWREMDKKKTGLKEVAEEHAEYRDKMHHTWLVGPEPIYDSSEIKLNNEIAYRSKDPWKPTKPVIQYIGEGINESFHSPKKLVVGATAWAMFDYPYSAPIFVEDDVEEESILYWKSDAETLSETDIKAIKANSYGVRGLNGEGIEEEIQNGNAPDVYNELVEEYGTGEVSAIYGS